ncbi:MAG: DUF4214 domain-containing protein [Actinomycetota bacterium]
MLRKPMLGRVSLRVAMGALFIAGAVTAVGPSAGAATETAGGSAAVSGCDIGTPDGEFTDQVKLSTGHARVWRLYQAFFLRQPDGDGFDYWIKTRNGGATLADIAYQFAQGPEFQARYGSLTHAEFVDLVYRNVLCRTPDEGGRNYWTAKLENGSLTRWDMVINFAELREYLNRTGTCRSIYPEESASIGDCSESALVPLGGADYHTHGYQQVEVSVSHNGRTGSFRGVKVDMTRGLFETGSSRCSVASINANWLVGSQKDGPNPSVLGIGVVDGIHVKGSSDRTDRGVLGLRFDTDPTNVVEVWPGDSLSADDTRLSSVLFHSGRTSIESWHAAAEMSPYLQELAPEEIVPNTDWVWAAAGVPLIIDGQIDSDFSSDYYGDPYTYQTLRHPFVAMDQDTKKLIFGATANLDTSNLIHWATTNGYEDLIKFDGGASAEYNIGGQAVVAGTSRDIPVWLGIGC